MNGRNAEIPDQEKSREKEPKFGREESEDEFIPRVNSENKVSINILGMNKFQCIRLITMQWLSDNFIKNRYSANIRP